MQYLVWICCHTACVLGGEFAVWAAQFSARRSGALWPWAHRIRLTGRSEEGYKQLCQAHLRHRLRKVRHTRTAIKSSTKVITQELPLQWIRGLVYVTCVSCLTVKTLSFLGGQNTSWNQFPLSLVRSYTTPLHKMCQNRCDSKIKVTESVIW